MQAAAMRGLSVAGEHLAAVSQAQAPIDEGTLRASVAVAADSRRVAVSYNTPYAVRQHEQLSYHHPHGGKAKYLEDPLNSEKPAMLEIIRASTQGAAQ